MSILETIHSLPIPSDTETLCVEAIIEDEFYVSKNHFGFSGILIKIESINHSFLTYSSESLDILVRNDCKIESENGSNIVSALTIQPKIADVEVVTSSFADMIVNYNFNKKENLDELNDYLSKLIELFTYKSDDNFALSSAIGLWGELYLISQFPNTVKFWRGSEGTTFDFQEKNISLEIKSSVKGKNFKIQSKQLLPTNVHSLVFAVNPELDYDIGHSVADLVEKITKIIPAQYVFEFVTSLSARGFVIGNDIPNFNKPFKLRFENPIVIDLTTIETNLMNSISSISKSVEEGFISKVELSFNYSQLKQLENITYTDFSMLIRRLL
jgi:hypothetical protein